MRVMVLVKASKDSEAGMMPTTEMFEAMGKFNEQLVNAGVMLAGAALWLAMHESGIHATLAAVVLGIVMPLFLGKRLIHPLHGVVAFGVVPVFVFVNAGVPLGGLSLEALSHPVSLGVVLGLGATAAEAGGKLYGNARFGFFIEIPALFPVQGAEPENGDGLSFSSPDGKAAVAASGGWIMEDSFAAEVATLKGFAPSL